MAARPFYYYLLKLLALSLITLFLIRISFGVYHFGSFASVSTKEIILSFLLGTFMDSAVVSTSLLGIFFIIYIVSVLIKKDLAKLFYHVTNVILSIFFLLNIIDIFFFARYGSRSNIMMLQGMERSDIILPMIWKEFPVIKVLLVYFALLYFFLRIHKALFRNIVPEKNSIKWTLLNCLSLFAFSFLYYGPPFWTLTSFSGSSTANQMAGNGVYSFLKSIDQEHQFNGELASYEYGNIDTALLHFQNTIIKKNEHLLSKDYPTRRSFDDPIKEKKNVVIIILESFAARNIGALGGKNLSPNFDRYSKKGVLFTDCFASGVRTQHGITAVLASFPPLLGSSLIRRKGLTDFQTIGNCLQQENYYTQFIHNGRADYDDMDLFLKQGGFENIVDVNDFKEWKLKNEWGVSDEDLYKKAFPYLWSKKNNPTLTVLLSMSNHDPYDLPEDFISTHPEIKNMSKPEAGFYYSDYALGKFLDSCAQQPEFKNTLFLITADHGEIYDQTDFDFKFFHIPALLLNSSQPIGTFKKTCSQIDLTTAVLYESGYYGPLHLIGQNPFSRDYLPFSLSKNYENTITMCKDSIAMQWDIRTSTPSFYKIDSTKHRQKIILDPTIKNSMLQFTKDYLQSISYIYRYGRYKL